MCRQGMLLIQPVFENDWTVPLVKRTKGHRQAADTSAYLKRTTRDCRKYERRRRLNKISSYKDLNMFQPSALGLQVRIKKRSSLPQFASFINARLFYCVECIADIKNK